ncbi:MAG: family 43 glycosylhydrolase [Clostridia bacterium]|nr:family 43 glycosylhydrolase [Clostridia bacterium]
MERRKILSVISFLLILLLMLPSCTGGEPADPGSQTEETMIPQKATELIVWKPGESSSDYRIVYDETAAEPLTAEAQMLAAMIKNYTGAAIETADSGTAFAKEIVLSSSTRPETAEMLEGLEEGAFSVRAVPGDAEGEGKLFIATTTYESAYACAQYLLESFYDPETGFRIPATLDITDTAKEYIMIESTIRKLRDPCILVEDGVYYAYGTGWKCYKNANGKLKGPWTDLGVVASVANRDTDGGDHWAPEVHRYNGEYYMFTTYKNSATSHRGCIILKSASPEGPFVEVTNGPITPSDWDCIDGTFYVDPDGQPWMVFVHEWTSMPDGVGSFAAAKLSEDLSHFISEPIELFKANEPVWATEGVTDGCWMYTTKEGDLLMLWSNFDAFGYVVAVARSSNGRLDGEWIHEKNLLYSKAMTGTYDGGHAMIFTDVDGQMYMSFHSPNTSTSNYRLEKPVFLAIEEKDGKLVWAENQQ